MNSTFEPNHFPLYGRRLIEASAGTGKTYNIANLYLRLLVGDDCAAKSVDQILVVTFTRAATNELRGRIRARVEMALHAFRGESCEDVFINAMVDKTADKAGAARRLNYALLRMDEACIFTIHGFAVRAIQTFLFETGALANVELTEGENHRKDLVLADLWRQLQLTGNETLKTYVDAFGFKNREAFTRYFNTIPDAADILPAFTIKTSSNTLEALLPQAEHHVESALARILSERKELAKHWVSICSKTTISDLKLVLGDSGNSKLFEKIDSLVNSDKTDLAMPGGKMLERMMGIHNSSANDQLAIFIRNIVKHIDSGLSRESVMKGVFRSLLLHFIRNKIQVHDLASMQLDEVIGLINNTLQEGGSKANQLRSMITHDYPVCMVDEFQDTDPAQFEMFNRLYENTEGTAFFMIGDPKQSIYGFRGADIFSYLAVKAKVETVFSLDTNFRSKQSLVTATNQLFSENDKCKSTFLFSGIQYADVKSCEGEQYKQDKGSYKPGYQQLNREPLVFIGNNSDDDLDKNKIDGDTLRWKYAQDTAQRIRLILDDRQPSTLQKPGEKERTLRGGDIAVLVRSAREAGIVRDALLAQNPRIGSVFQSQRDSVFASSIIADDIYHLLCAMDDPKNKRKLKNAMVTLLYRGFRLDFSALDNMELESVAGENTYENLVNEFSCYQQQWNDYGVLSALNLFVRQHQLLSGMALLPDGDRLLTDFRHLGELLQHKYLECSSREELLGWYRQQLTDDSELEADAKRIRLESDDNLVKIVTIHVSKGLEYPLVFLPFFFLSWQLDSDKKLPLYHPEPDYRPRIDFMADDSDVKKVMRREILAEDMRLLYVAITRAIYQCYIGISASVHGKDKKPVFPNTVWAHLLDMSDTKIPDWKIIREALQKKFTENGGKDNKAIGYQQLFELRDIALPKMVQAGQAFMPELVTEVKVPALAKSSWVITSYSALAHARNEPGLQKGGADEVITPVDALVEWTTEKDSLWENNIRYRLKSSANTGDCLHGIYEQLALDPSLLAGEQLDLLLQHSLQKHGLENPEDINTGLLTDEKKEQLYRARRHELIEWLTASLQQPLLAIDNTLTLQKLFLDKQVLAELDFDFSLGSAGKVVKIQEGMNAVLGQIGVASITMPYQQELEGLVTGSIDLLFIHNKKVYVLDYKSNKLGKAPSFYDQANMTQAIKENRYDLQYLIYSVAAHRYMQSRLGKRYHFDGGEYSFGGVFYLFLRGMGLEKYKQHGIWFHRPSSQQILAIDSVLKGETAGVETNSG